MVKRKSRAARWADAVAAARTAHEAVSAAYSDLESAMSELKDIQSEFEEWKDNLPENLQTSALGEKLEAVCDLDFELQLELDEISEAIDNAEGADLPLGFGRD